MLDLAAGTGKLTRLLLQRFEQVTAVEPDEEMRALLGDTAPRAEVFAGTAERIPLDAAAVDAVFVADAFHWFGTRAAVAEIGRVLRPGGGLVLLWKGWDRAQFDPPMPEPVLERLDAIYVRSGRPGGARYASREWREAFAGSPFEPLREDEVQHTVALERDAAVSLWLSVSSVASLPHHERVDLAREMREALAAAYRLTERVAIHWTRLAT